MFDKKAIIENTEVTDSTDATQINLLLNFILTILSDNLSKDSALLNIKLSCSSFLASLLSRHLCKMDAIKKKMINLAMSTEEAKTRAAYYGTLHTVTKLYFYRKLDFAIFQDNF